MFHTSLFGAPRSARSTGPDRSRLVPPRRLRPLAIGSAAVIAAGLLLAAPPSHAAEPWQPDSGYTSTDKGDGTYTVPLFNADVPDVSVERVPASENDEGRDIYYMISTTMHLSPGAPIMKSYDLVNWEIVNYVFDRADISDSFSLRNGQSSYGQGQWASSIRYHNGKWYVAFNTNNLGGSYIYVTEDIDNGSWDRIALGRAYHDPSLFFDVDGTPYIFYGSGSTSAVKLSTDMKTVVAEYPQILRTSDYPGSSFLGGLFEGAQVQYIDGKYYIVIITWPSGQGRQVVLFRSDELLGRYSTADGSNPYEAKGVLNSNGFAQGSLVPIEGDDGSTEWSGMFFRDTFPIGRIPALIPATWTDGWPTFGTNGSVPVNGAFEKPIELSPAEALYERQKSIVVSDDFDNDAPQRAYMDEEWTIPAAPTVDQSLLGVELFANPGFESGADGWIVNDTATITPSTDAASGAGSLLVSGRTTTGSGPAQDVSGKVQHNVTYDLTAKVKYENPNSPATKQFFLTARYGGSTFTNLASVTATRGQWATITGSFTVPSTQSLSSMRLFVETPWTSNANALAAPDTHLMDFKVDDFSLKGRPLTTELPHPDEIGPNGSRLALQWEWNHAPDNRYWSLTDREGWLRLTTGKVLTGTLKHLKLANDDEAAYLEEARNTLSQRTFGPRQSAETKLEISGMKNGDVAGLAAYNRGFSYVAVKRVNGVNTVGVVNRTQPFTTAIDQAAIESFLPGTTAALGSASEVHLKADLDFANPTGQLWSTFSYSLDGITWTQLGNRVGPQTLDGSLTHFMGHRVGLFNYATQQAGGHVDFDHYLLSDTLTSQNLPLDRSDLESAIAHAATLDEEDYPDAEWDELEEVLADAEAASSRPAGTQNQLDAPERALSLQLARLGVLKEPEPSLDLSLSTASRCVAGKVVLTVQASNGEPAAVSLSMSTPFGTKAATLAPSKSASYAFTSRQVSVPAAAVEVEASATIEGELVTVSLEEPYAARSCG
ncbi:family 43 glycosylhydrolase [Microbacterium sp. CFBP9034]|uniref:family 43 glycosylhydrolase n=1 Tax=Microbacterium sp. CFBP9034 TaxID=3096540 RepID=UPI002A6A523B|nr:family 43 glycosylhydrolase [Microbacterium sp. CFBP9034]MDY0908834.1 family 43 glycosylhydrolase [Microbacterium sp. CFBP9034]